MSWAADGSRTRAASREATGAAEYVELTGPDGVHFMLVQPMDTRQVTITPATPTSLPPSMRPPAVYSGKPTYAAAEPEAIAAELDLMLPAYKSAAHLARLAVLSGLVRDLDGISTTWGAVEAAFEREPRPDRTERLAARRHRDRTAWKAMESSTMVLRAVLDHTQRLLDTRQLSPDSGPAEALKDLTETARTLNDRFLKQWNRKQTSGTLEAQIKAGDRMNWAWPLAESLRTQLPQIIALSDAASATRPAVSSRAQAARSGLRRGPAGTAAALVEGWKAAIRSANGRRR
ncbi:hypothetical protein [Streptacidiphilus neutrinimicus]|uniref:hypothetical protein n=1 Tax=Streptacidiphilus neutrinimicus TaxID=105420 RepID=UPI00126A2D9B|nr:hypothetical protein [Streptacidiphilus neutrinimicus]